MRHLTSLRIFAIIAITLTTLVLFCVVVIVPQAAVATDLTWRFAQLPIPSTTTKGAYEQVDSISCSQPEECTAVAAFDNQPTALTDHSGTWSSAPMPYPTDVDLPGNSPLYNRMTCAAPSMCLALGAVASHYLSTPTPDGFFATEANGVWTAQDASPPLNAPYPGLKFEDWVASSCPSTTWCMALAVYSTATEGNFGELAVAAYIISDTTATAAWLPLPSDASSPQTYYPYQWGPNSLACALPESCVIVGTYSSEIEANGQSQGFQQLFPAIWNYSKTGWTATRAPEPSTLAGGGGSADLNEVSCPAIRSCTAVGEVKSAFGSTPIVLQETDGNWSSQVLPTPEDSYSSFARIACPEVAGCNIVLYSVFHGEAPEKHYQRLYDAQILDNKISSLATIPEPSDATIPSNLTPSDFSLYKQVCFTPDTCLMTTRYTPLGTTSEQGAFISLEGGRLTALSAPVPNGSLTTELYDLSCPTESFCAATGGPDGPSLILTGNDSGGLTVQQPTPQPPLPVMVAGGGGGGIAGVPDPSSLEHGHCDPGDNTNWLHIAGITFVCIASLQVWNEPDLISAKNKCIISLGIDVAPFLKLLKARKYVVEAGVVTASLQTLAQRLAVASYPKKLAGDVQAIDDLRTALRAIKAPEQALLTVVSSRRVLDGLIAKLGTGGPQAPKLAQDIAVVENAITSLVETVTGIQDVKDCVTAFGGP
jgi:hypothetical protein